MKFESYNAEILIIFIVKGVANVKKAEIIVSITTVGS